MVKTLDPYGGKTKLEFEKLEKPAQDKITTKFEKEFKQRFIDPFNSAIGKAVNNKNYTWKPTNVKFVKDGKNFDNTRGHQMITVNGLADSNIAGKAINIAAYGAKDKYTNKDGVSNIDVLAAKTTAPGSSVNIGLQNMQYLGSLNINNVYLI